MTANANASNGQPATPVEEFIGKRQVARRLNKTVRTVDNWMQCGLLPYYKVGRSVVFKWTEIDEHLARTCRVCRPNISR